MLANSPDVADWLLTGEGSILGDWRKALDNELRNPDSTFDKQILATAYTVIETICATIQEVGKMPQDEGDKKP